MAKKTYIPFLVALLRRACVYITKYKTVLVRYLPEGGEAALDAIVLACDVFMALVPDNTAP